MRAFGIIARAFVARFGLGKRFRLAHVGRAQRFPLGVGVAVAALAGALSLNAGSAAAQPFYPGGGYAQSGWAPPTGGKAYVPHHYAPGPAYAPRHYAPHPQYYAPRPSYAPRPHYYGPPHHSYGRRRHWDGGAAVAAGIFGLAAGAIIANAAQPHYRTVYVDRPHCTIRRQKVWIAPDAYTIRRVRVCR